MVPAVNTSLISVATAVVAVVVVLPLAYLTARHRTRFGGVANTVVVGGFALPGLVIALALVFWALSAPAGAVFYQTLPLLVFAYVVHFGAQSMRAAQVAVGGVPGRLEDAARMLGAGRARRFTTVELPLMMPGLLAGGRAGAAVHHEGAPGHPAVAAHPVRDARRAHLERGRGRLPGRGRAWPHWCWCSSAAS